MNDFVTYLLEHYTDYTEGASGFDGNLEEEFQKNLWDFFDNLLIWNDDIKSLADQFGGEIIQAAMRMMAAEQLPPENYTDLSSFLNLAFRGIEEQYYNKFKDIFFNN